MPLVRGEEGSSISRGQGVIILFKFFFSPTGIFRVCNQGKSQNYMKYFQALALEVFTFDTNRPLDMDEPCHAGKVIIAIYSRVTLM